MAEAIGIERLRQLIAEDALIVDVLPPREFGEEHLPGAINLPLKRLGRETVEGLDRGRAIVVYCWDGL